MTLTGAALAARNPGEAMTVETPTAPPLEVVTPIKPSEAIRLGCLTTAPTTGTLRADDGSTCVLGAMIVGFGGRPYGVDGLEGYPAPYQKFRHGDPLPTPDNPNDVMSPGGLVMWLNDGEGWPRERIADYLESLGL